MAKLLIIYASRTGNTEAMAKAVYEGALSSGATTSLKKATEATMDDLLNCNAVIFGTPTNLSYMAGTMKEFFDQAYLNLEDKEVSKPYAAFNSGLTKGTKVLKSIDHVCDEFRQWSKFKFEKAHEGVATIGKPSSEVLEECKQLGKKMAQL